MYNRKYGDIREIWSRTGGKCHLCHRPVDLDTYGLIALYGAEAASIDHLTPQSHGGDHHPDNLRIAHHGCNSRRGTRDPIDARESASGRSWEPLSDGERLGVVLASAAACTALGAGVGVALSGPTPDKAGQARAAQGAVVGAVALGLVGLIGSLALTA